jgi:hypothetical protein
MDESKEKSDFPSYYLQILEKIKKKLGQSNLPFNIQHFVINYFYDGPEDSFSNFINTEKYTPELHSLEKMNEYQKLEAELSEVPDGSEELVDNDTYFNCPFVLSFSPKIWQGDNYNFTIKAMSLQTKQKVELNSVPSKMLLITFCSLDKEDFTKKYFHVKKEIESSSLSFVHYNISFVDSPDILTKICMEQGINLDNQFYLPETDFSDDEFSALIDIYQVDTRKYTSPFLLFNMNNQLILNRRLIFSLPQTEIIGPKIDEIYTPELIMEYAKRNAKAYVEADKYYFDKFIRFDLPEDWKKNIERASLLYTIDEAEKPKLIFYGV